MRGFRGDALYKLTIDTEDRSFATAGPRAWNKLLSHLRLMQSADTFRCHLTTFVISPGFFIMTMLGALVTYVAVILTFTIEQKSV